MKKLIFPCLFICLLNLNGQAPQFGFPDNFQKDYYSYIDAEPGVNCLKDQVILKILPEYRDLCENNAINILEINQVLNYAKVTEVRKLYPYHQEPTEIYDELGRKKVDLSLIYNITYSGDLDVRKMITELNGLEAVDYAQPRFVEEPQWVPNDTSIGDQWALSKVRAFQAWDLDTGSNNIVIGIVDGGTNFTHPDLMTNVYYNMNDTIDGLDNDNDGFIDNYRGWDVGDWDNNPQYIGAFNSAHGTSMCGLAAGSPHNVAAISGSGYRCGYMPVKMVHSTFGWIAGYEGLVYAADHGAVILNASWGGTLPGPYGQDVVNYVTVNQGCVMFAAAGNSDNMVRYYPATFENVICVGGMDSLDVKSPGSCYYEQVDMVSPGERLFEPYATGYGFGYGTSDASAFTSGAAGIVQSYHSGMTPLQIGAILRQSTYRIDTIAGNAPYLNMQGSGRLDMYAALTNNLEPFIELNAREYSDNNDNVLLIGDTVSIWGNMLNILDTSSASLTAYISDNSPFISWVDSSVNLGILNTLEFTNTSAQPFRFNILPGCPVNQSVLFRVDYYDGTDTLNTQYFTFYVNRDYYNVKANNLSTTVTTTGRIGFSDNNTLTGVGYRMKGKENNLLGIYFNPMSLFVSQNTSSVGDQTISTVTGPCCPFASDNDFTANSGIEVVPNPVTSDLEVITSYNDTATGAGSLNLNIREKLYAWGDSVNSQFLILEYQFEKNGGTALGDWYAGLFGEFDMPDSIVWNLGSNYAFFDTSSQTAIIHNAAPRYYIGFKILGPANVKYYANNNDGSGGTQLLYDGFSDLEKHTMMNPGVPSNASLVTDVSHYLGVQFDTLAVDGCTMFHVALLIGNSLSDIQNQAAAAETKFNGTFNIWTGAAMSSDWHTPGNWSQGSVPDYNDHVIVPDTRGGSGFSPIISGGDGTVKNIEIRCGGQLEVNPPNKLFVGN